jgi:hypothetical protein
MTEQRASSEATPLTVERFNETNDHNFTVVDAGPPGWEALVAYRLRYLNPVDVGA